MPKNHTHCSVESVTDRGATTPSLFSMRGLGRRAVEVEQQPCLPRAIEDRGPPSRCPFACCSETSTAQYIIYNINRLFGTRIVLRNIVSSSLHYAPWSSSSPPPPPPEKNIHVLPKNVSHQVSHHQCADPRIDPIGKPPSANPVHRTHAKDSHPKLASDRALTPSRTRISSPPAIAREERRACSNNLPRRNATATRARAMGQDYPLTGPSPGANPPIHPSSLPRASGNLFSDISPKSHGFFFFSNSMEM